MFYRKLWIPLCMVPLNVSIHLSPRSVFFNLYFRYVQLELWQANGVYGSQYITLLFQPHSCLVLQGTVRTAAEPKGMHNTASRVRVHRDQSRSLQEWCWERYFIAHQNRRMPRLPAVCADVPANDVVIEYYWYHVRTEWQRINQSPCTTRSSKCNCRTCTFMHLYQSYITTLNRDMSGA